MNANKDVELMIKELSKEITDGMIVFDEKRVGKKKKINKTELKRLAKEIRKTLVYAG